MNFRIGQKVVCIDAKHLPGMRPDIPIVAGEIYTIRWIGILRGVPMVRVEEHFRPNSWPEPDIPMLAERFRPVVEKKTDISIFTEMLKPKQRERVSQ